MSKQKAYLGLFAGHNSTFTCRYGHFWFYILSLMLIHRLKSSFAFAPNSLQGIVAGACPISRNFHLRAQDSRCDDVISETGHMIIQSSSNQRLKLIRNLIRNRRARKKSGQVVLEGSRLVLDYAGEGGLDPDLLIVSHEVLSGPSGGSIRELMERLDPSAVSVAPHKLLCACLDTTSPQGVVAVVKRPTLALPPAPSLLLLCDGVNDPGNFGTLVRSAAGVGCVDGVVAMGSCCDPFGPKALRAAMGAAFRLPILERLDVDGTGGGDLEASPTTWAQNKGVLQGLGMTVYAADGAGTMSYTEVDWCKPSALIVGSEANGLSPEVRADLGRPGGPVPIRIPLYNEIESLNAGVAGSIILAECQRQRS